MSELKRFFSKAKAQEIAAQIQAAWPKFDAQGFVRDGTKGLESLELMDRGRLLARALHQHLPSEFPKAAAVLTKSLGPTLDDTEGHGMSPFTYLPHVLWVAEHGLEHFDEALAFQHAVTQRFSAEFSIRAWLTKDSKRTLARLATWVDDPSVHVRRLVSEGTRPLLPWASRLPELQQNPKLALPLLERLRDDPERYVRRSVANHLNDIGKAHPELLVDVARTWSRGASNERKALISHALRSLVKRGDPGALAVLGYGDEAKVKLGAITLPASARIGERLDFDFELVSTGASTQRLLVDFAVHFVKSSGGTSPKVFKLTQLELGPKQRAVVKGRVSLRQHTTRTHFPGAHRLEALVNGARFELGVVQVKR